MMYFERDFKWSQTQQGKGVPSSKYCIVSIVKRAIIGKTTPLSLHSP